MPPEPDDQLNDAWTVGEIADAFEGRPFHDEDDRDHFMCDWCSTGVSYARNSPVGGYFGDLVMNTSHPKWQHAMQEAGDQHTIVPLAAYCEDCTYRRLLFPCEGYGEVRAIFTIDDDRRIADFDVTDVSPRDDGIPWDPREVSERVGGVDFDVQDFMGRISGDDYLWAPENMVTYFLSVTDGVDIRELVNYDGSLDPKALGRARKAYDEYAQKIRERTGSRSEHRKAFRDHVRGGRGK